MTEADGKVGYEDLVDGVSMNETTDEATGITKRVVIDWRSSAGTSLRRRSCTASGRQDPKLARGGEARYSSRSTPFSRWSRGVDEGRRRAGAYPDRERPRPATSPAVCRVSPSSSKRVAEGCMRSSPKSRAASNSARLQEQAPHHAVPHDDTIEPVEYLIPKGKHLPVQEGDFVEGRLHPRRQPGAARHPGDQGRGGARLLPRQRDPGGLSPAGREHQRQAHRGDRPPDAAEGRDHQYR
jgi:DNA-directed RNA polymerase subunit beta'